MPIPAWTIGLAIRGVATLVRHRRDRKRRRLELEALRKEAGEMNRLGNVLGWILQLKVLDGITAKIGAVGLVFSALGSLVGRYTGQYEPLYTSPDLELLALGNGLGILGIRKRQDRRS